MILLSRIKAYIALFYFSTADGVLILKKVEWMNAWGEHI
jgi:hypothetical protein